MTSQTSSLNIAIKNGKQLIIPVTNRRQQNILQRNYLEYSKSKKRQNKETVTYMLKQSKKLYLRHSK